MYVAQKTIHTALEWSAKVGHLCVSVRTKIFIDHLETTSGSHRLVSRRTYDETSTGSRMTFTFYRTNACCIAQLHCLRASLCSRHAMASNVKLLGFRSSYIAFHAVKILPATIGHAPLQAYIQFSHLQR